MSFTKLLYKFVNSTRSTSILRSREVAIDGTSMYVGDGSTVGGLPIVSPKITSTYATTQLGAGYTYGSGPEVSITDNAATEVIEITNGLGAAAAVEVPNVTTVGKQVILYSNDTDATLVYWQDMSGGDSNSTVVTNASTGVLILIWCGTGYASHKAST